MNPYSNLKIKPRVNQWKETPSEEIFRKLVKNSTSYQVFANDLLKEETTGNIVHFPLDEANFPKGVQDILIAQDKKHILLKNSRGIVELISDIGATKLWLHYRFYNQATIDENWENGKLHLEPLYGRELMWKDGFIVAYRLQNGRSRSFLLDTKNDTISQELEFRPGVNLFDRKMFRALTQIYKSGF